MSQHSVSSALKRPHNFSNLVENRRRILSALEFIEYCQAIDADPGETMDAVVARLKLKRAPMKG